MSDSDDPRDEEMSTLSAIYPEIEVDSSDPHLFVLEIPVHPSKPVQVLFPAPAPAPAPVIATGPETVPLPVQAADNRAGELQREDSHELSYLPPVRLLISLPPKYPAQQPPKVELTSNPPWIPSTRIDQLVADCARLWKELDHDPVLFTYIDHIQQLAETAFDVADDRGVLTAEPQYRIAILDYDMSAKRAAFDRETFDCGICLDPKKGSACHRMLDCGHVFCIGCLQDFYNNAIQEGDISSVRCLTPNCAKDREKAAAQEPPTSQGAGGRAKRKRRQNLISPSELLKIPLEPEVVRRFVTLKYKSELESDKNTVYCPRSWCNGAARSKKHKKPEGLEFSEDSEGSDDEDTNRAQASAVPRPYNKTEELLCICEDCGFAFCGRCFLGWHGEFYRCTPRRDKTELTAEEKASLEYVQLHTTPCPTCAAPAQKTHGCNHMICGRQGCGTHFCYLCSAWLDPTNPYSHYNQQSNGRITGCYNRLWELEAGDGDDVGLGFIGGRAALAAEQEIEVDAALLIPEIEEADGEDGHVNGAAAGAAGDHMGVRPANEHENERGVALEAPLVLRIAADPPGRAAPPPVPNPPPVARPRAGGQQNARRRGGRGGQNAVRGGRGGANVPQQNEQARNNGAPRRGRGGRPRGGAVAPEDDRPNDDDLNEHQRAWIRQFVHMALNDEEDLVDSDSDEEIFWIR
ncbi:hypothetical protein MCOR25_010013 [Pyricularia grisea]|uniref:RBR-type E3 ubiquitin transferase n=1 Tax=Pyricularia grisea TaxID=148305 RepID=A0A6P8AWM9_PYRGI|nr:uncharacterized protein PgNI_08586 [Pyricularia grisea]KAI6351305.1 hypothetical protein MCOR25_010013 [Pyricularia grisea]TLD06628.1 hypothetical protein PgNI_08586 [Pyricularia grisea]